MGSPVTKALGKAGSTRSYTFVEMPATDAWEVMKILGLPVVSAFMAMKPGSFNARDAATVGGALQGLPRADFDTVRDLLLKSVSLGGKAISNFDVAFTGKMFELLLVLREALAVSFADFLDALKPASSPSEETA